MGILAGGIYLQEETPAACVKLLAMTKNVRTSLSEAKGIAAAALAVVLKLGPQDQEIRTSRTPEELLSGAPVHRSEVLLYYEALIDSVDERIAALTRVLQAPDDNPQEVAAARAQLARSKAYPGPVRATDSQADSSAGRSEETYGGSVLDGVVLSKEERWALELYQALLTRDESGKGDRPEFDIPSGGDKTDKEALRIELDVQKIYRSRLSKGMVRPDTHTEELQPAHDPYVHAQLLKKEKEAMFPMMNAAKTVPSMKVENIVMTSSPKPSGLITLPPYLGHLQNQPKVKQYIETAINPQLRADYESYKSPFGTKAEKLCDLINIISNRNEREQIIARFGAQTLGVSRESRCTDGLLDKEGSSDRKQEQQSSADQNKAESTDPAGEETSSDSEKQLLTKKKHEDLCPEEETLSTGNNGNHEASTITEQTGPSGDGPEKKSSINTESSNLPGARDEPKRSGETTPGLGEVQRVFAPPFTRADMISALSRVLRWREQLLSKSHEKHRAHQHKRVVKEALDGFKHDTFCEAELTAEYIKMIYDGRALEHSDSGVRDLAIEDVTLSGSVKEATEVHICKQGFNRETGMFHETGHCGQWVSGDQRTVMPIWYIRKRVLPKESGNLSKLPYTYELSPAEQFTQVSDVDFMLQLGPVKSIQRPTG